MRTIWSGSLSFGLVNIPVGLVSASRERALSFRLLDKQSHSPVRYKKVTDDGDEVAQRDIVKGYEYEKGSFVIIEPDDFKKAAPKKTQTIELVQFTDSSAIDPMYFDKPYYLVPEKKSAKAYALLREALAQSGKVGIARYVLREKEHIGLVEPHEGILLLQQMRYQDELRPADEIDSPEAAPTKKELDLAMSLIDNLTEPFEPDKFKDTYTQELKKVIEAKAKGKRITITPEREPVATSATDILKALQKSLSEEPQPLHKKAHGTKRVQKKKGLRKNVRTRT